MVKKKRRVLELTEFKIKGSHEEEEVKRASDKANKFIEKQPGFEHRMILKDKTKWLDAIQWRNVDYAKQARKEMKKSEECKDYLKLISEKSIHSNFPELIKMY